jgi:hypothetical protein
LSNYNGIKERLASLTGLPWRLENIWGKPTVVNDHGNHEDPFSENDYRFIVHAPDDMERLLAEVERIGQQLDIIVSVNDSGQKARRRAEKTAEALAKQNAKLRRELSEAKKSIARLSAERDEARSLVEK